ncbi:MAG: MarR family winged helix-turn-helix transcriptional regulator [Firmicutes bacterium]|nr:MarR family winged helix-turn-helix transcriptional regulator [Bacillota bacterium]
MTEEQADELHRLMNQYSHIFNQNVSGYFNDHDKELKQKNLTFHERQAMFVINHYDGCSPSVISQGIGMARSNASRLINSIVKKGYVTKTKNIGKKVVNLTLTKKGEEIIQEEKTRKQRQYVTLYNTHIPQKEQDRLFELYKEMIKIWGMIPPKK